MAKEKKQHCCPKCAGVKWPISQGEGLATCSSCNTLFRTENGQMIEVIIGTAPVGPTDYAIANAQAAEERITCLRTALKAIKEMAKMGNTTVCFSVAFEAIKNDDEKVE